MTRPQQTTNRGVNEAALPWQTRTVAVHRGASQTLRRDRSVSQFLRILRNECSATWSVCGPFEWVAFAYLTISSVLIAIFATNVEHPVRLLVTRACVVGLTLLLCRGAKVFAGDESEPATYSQKFLHFWRHWYPHLFFLFCFEELAHLVHLISPRWQDARLIAFDLWLTGVRPSIWLEQFTTPVRNDFMQFTYITYFTYLLVLGGILYYRKDFRGYWSVMTYSAVAYAIGYLIAISFPIESPWFAMAGSWNGELRGGPFTAVINYIEHFGRVRGAAFPSEHVAGSFAALWGAWRHRRWLFWIMLPLVLCMCASTIWGRYHYIADIFGGVATGTLGYFLGAWLMRKSQRTPDPARAR
jgi:membrane-associated phospholipid phosphatase